METVEQPRVALHLCNHAASTSGADCVLALARAGQKLRGLDERPPTSVPSTTKRARPPSLDIRHGWRPFLKLTRRAREVRPTSSIASCAPRHKARPKRCSPRSMSLTQTFVATRAPASRQTCAAAHSRGNLLFPNTPASTHAERWWPNMSSWRPHRQGAQSEGKAKQEVERLRAIEWCRSEGAMLGSEEGPRWTVEERPNLGVNETLFHHARRN